MFQLDHIAIVTPKLESMVLKLHLGLKLERPDLGDISEHEDTGTREVYIGQEGLSHRILVIEPYQAGPYKDALKKRGESIHHIGLKTKDIAEACDAFERTHWKIHLSSMRHYKNTGSIYLCQSGLPLLEFTEVKTLGKNPKSFLSQLTLPGPIKEWSPLKSDTVKTTRKDQALFKRDKAKFSI